jgi:hypothetical protein
MADRTDLHAHARSEFGGKTEARTENFQDQGIARADEFDAPAQAYAKRLEALRVLVVRINLTHDGAGARRQFIEAYGGGLGAGCHSDGKISFSTGKSNLRPVFAGAGLLFIIGSLRFAENV